MVLVCDLLTSGDLENYVTWLKIQSVPLTFLGNIPIKFHQFDPVVLTQSCNLLGGGGIMKMNEIQYIDIAYASQYQVPLFRQSIIGNVFFYLLMDNAIFVKSRTC